MILFNEQDFESYLSLYFLPQRKYIHLIFFVSVLQSFQHFPRIPLLIEFVRDLRCIIYIICYWLCNNNNIFFVNYVNINKIFFQKKYFSNLYTLLSLIDIINHLVLISFQSNLVFLCFGQLSFLQIPLKYPIF